MTMKKIDFHKDNVVSLMAEIIMKINEIVKKINRMDAGLNALQKKTGGV